MKLLTIATVALISTAGLAAASECTTEWSIDPFVEYNDSGYDSGTTAGVNLTFSFGGSSLADCKAAEAERRNQEAEARLKEARTKHENARRAEQEIDNMLARLALCQEALKLNAPRLIAECRADGFIE